MSEQDLKVKIVADVSQYKRGVNEAKQATEDFGNSSKQTASKVERLEATIKDQQNQLKNLKGEYRELTATQDKSSTAVKELESKMKMLNTQLTLNQQKLKMAQAAGNSFSSSMDGSAGISATNSAMGDLEGTLQQITTLQMADVFTNMMAAIAATRKEAQLSSSSFKMFFEEFKGMFDFKNMDVGDDGLWGYFETMMVQGKEALGSLREGFKHLGQTIKNVMKSSMATIAATIAVMVTFVGIIRSAISMSAELRKTFFDAQSIGMSVKAYQEWGYILQNVGVEVDKLSDFLKTLADEQNAVRDGSEEMIQAFAALGISAEEAAGMTQEQLFTRTVEGLQNITDEVQRTSIAYRIFGEDAAYLTNVLNLSNSEMEQMVSNYYLLGGAASDSAIQKSLQLSGAIADLKTAWTGLTNTLGEGFMPMIISVVQWITKAIAVVKMFVRALFGFDIVSSSSGSVDNLTASVGGYTGAVEDATAAAEQLKRTTQGFDELNIMSNPSSGGGGSGAGAGGGVSGGGGGGFNTDDLGLNTEDLGLDGWKEKIEKWKEEISVIGPAAMVAVGGIGGLLAALSGNWALAVTLFAMAGLGLVAMEGGDGFESYVEAFVGYKDGILVAATIAVGAIGAVIGLLTGNIPMAIACIGLAAIGVYLASSDKFGEKVGTFARHVANIALWATTGIGLVGGLIALITGNIPMAIALLALAVLSFAGLGAMNGWWEAIHDWFVGLFSKMGDRISDVWDTICGFFKFAWKIVQDVWGVCVDFFKGIWTGIQKIFDPVHKWFGTIFSKAWTGIKDAWSSVKNWFTNLWSGIKAIFEIVKTWFPQIFQQAWTGIKNAFSSVGTFFTGIWNKIKDIFSKVGSSIGNAVSNAFSKAINWVLEKAIGIINGFISAINFAIGIINKIPGVEIGYLDKLSVPQLATGGIAVGDTLAHIGEGGKREAVLPLDQNTGWMDDLADRISARNSAPSKIVLKVDGRELGWASINNINDITKQTGGLQLHIV